MRARQIRRRLTTLLPYPLAILLALLGAGSALAQVYTVQSGDTLYDIGMQYGVEPVEIARYNGIDADGWLQVGQRLTIPESSGTVSWPSGATYVVVPGDTLGDIADEFGVSVDDLAAANSIGDRSYLYAGQKLTIPGDGAVATAETSATVGASTYVVGRGDTLSGIADIYGLSATTVAAANGIHNPDSLTVGQELVIPERAQVSGRGGSRLAFVWPAFGEITGYFHEPGPYWVKGYHEGLDLGAAYGSPIRAAEEGIVIEASAGWHKGYGTYVKIDHGNGLHTLYGHMSELAVDPWEPVKRGQVIGYVGSTGASTGPHLHFEVRVDGEKKDPLQYLP